MSDRTSGTDDEDDEPQVNYRGKISESEWEEFKGNVPSNVRLHERLNVLIREHNRLHREGKWNETLGELE